MSAADLYISLTVVLVAINKNGDGIMNKHSNKNENMMSKNELASSHQLLNQ